MQPGDKVERYEIERLLGEGATSCVFAARDPQLERSVALKVLRREVIHDRQYVGRFLEDVRTTATLEHPNIVGVRDFGTADGTPFIVMELVDGQSLDRLLAERGRLDVSEAARIARDVALALGAAHALGITHLDVKPSNILIDRRTWAVKLTDFGAAKRERPRDQILTTVGQVIGAPRYMAPEQVNGEPVDTRTDLWLLGVTLYEMLAGWPPFDADNEAKLYQAIVHKTPPKLAMLRPGLPPGLAGLTERLLAKSPSARPASADEVARMLAPFARPAPSVPEGRSLPRPRASTGFRFRSATVAGVGLTAAAAGAGIGAMVGVGVGIVAAAGVGLTVAGAVVAVPRIVARVMDGIEVRARARATASVPREETPKTSDGSTMATMLPAIHAPRRAGADPVAPGAQPVDAAVFCPPRVAKGSFFLVQIFLYPPGAEHEAAARAHNAEAAAERRGTYSLPLDLPSGTRVDMRLDMPDLVVVEPDGFLIWRRRPTASQFEVTVPAGTPGAEAIGRVRFAVDGIPAGTLRFKIKLAAAGSELTAMALREIEAVRYRRAFVSYSSQDRAEVLRRVQAFRIAGLSVFQDLLDVDPGEWWERELYQEIDVCDVFLLFWSRAAAASEWVAKEIAYALARKAGSDDRPPAIQPVPIEGPPPPPPETLRHLHFNDALLAQIQVASAQPAPASTP